MILLISLAVSAVSSEISENLKHILSSKHGNKTERALLRSDQSELQKILGKWSVSTVQVDATMVNYTIRN
jgi:hypothetical protein